MDYKEIKLLTIDKKNHQEVEDFVAFVDANYGPSAFPLTTERALLSGVIYFRAIWQDQWIGVTGLDQKTPFLAETVKTILSNELRGQGLGRALSLAIEEECRRRGIKKVMTTIYATNVSMINIKLQQGYTIEGYHRDHEAPGFHEYSLGKVLSI